MSLGPTTLTLMTGPSPTKNLQPLNNSSSSDGKFSPLLRRNDDAGEASTITHISLQTFPPERYPNLVRHHGGIISVPRKLTSHSSPQPAVESQKLRKLLLSVTIDRSLGPIQVVALPENTVRDLIKAAIENYVNEKMRPLLTETDPDCFDLHYSQFSLKRCTAGLRPQAKLKNLGSRNLLLSAKGNYSVNCCCSEELKMAVKAPFPWTNFMDFLL